MGCREAGAPRGEVQNRGHNSAVQVVATHWLVLSHLGLLYLVSGSASFGASCYCKHSPQSEKSAGEEEASSSSLHPGCVQLPCWNEQPNGIINSAPVIIKGMEFFKRKDTICKEGKAENRKLPCEREGQASGGTPVRPLCLQTPLSHRLMHPPPLAPILALPCWPLLRICVLPPCTSTSSSRTTLTLSIFLHTTVTLLPLGNKKRSSPHLA